MESYLFYFHVSFSFFFGTLYFVLCVVIGKNVTYDLVHLIRIEKGLERIEKGLERIEEK